jgi:hypothetical protein
MSPQTSKRKGGFAVSITLRTENTAQATQLTMATVYAFHQDGRWRLRSTFPPRGSPLRYVPETRLAGECSANAAPDLFYALVFLLK